MNLRSFARIEYFVPLALLAVLGQACAPPPTSGTRRTIETTATPPALNIGEEGEILFLTRQSFIDPGLYSDFQSTLETEITELHYTTNEEALTLLRSFGDHRSYGLVLASNFAAQSMIEEGLLAELDTRNIPNLDRIDARFQVAPYDPGNRFCAPVQWSTTGLVYDSSQTSPPEHWGALFTSNPGSPVYGRIALSDDARASFAAALLHLGYDVNSQDDREIREAAEILRQSNAGRVGFMTTSLAEGLISREVALAQAENRSLSPPLETNENLAYALPSEGAILHVDSLCIPITAPPEIKAAAERFINFVLEPQTNVWLAAYNFAASPVDSAREILPVGTVGEEFMYPENLDFVPLYLIQPAGAAEALYEDLFESIKSGG